MSFRESFENNEREPVARLTVEEFKEITSVFGDQVTSPEFQQRLTELGVPFNASENVVTIKVDGLPLRMVTREGDFGTLLHDPETTENYSALNIDRGPADAATEAWLGEAQPGLAEKIEAENRREEMFDKAADAIKGIFRR